MTDTRSRGRDASTLKSLGANALGSIAKRSAAYVEQRVARSNDPRVAALGEVAKLGAKYLQQRHSEKQAHAAPQTIEGYLEARGRLLVANAEFSADRRSEMFAVTSDAFWTTTLVFGDEGVALAESKRERGETTDFPNQFGVWACSGAEVRIQWSESPHVERVRMLTPNALLIGRARYDRIGDQLTGKPCECYDGWYFGGLTDVTRAKSVNHTGKCRTCLGNAYIEWAGKRTACGHCRGGVCARCDGLGFA